MKVHEEAMKMMGKAIEEIDWICANGDAHDLKDACDMACRRMEEAIALIQQLDGEMSELERVRVDLTATNMQLRDAVFKNELFKRRLEEERSAFEAQVPRWISVEERLPETCEDVLVWAEYHEENGRTWGLQEIDNFYKGVSWKNTADPDVRKVTHWMPRHRPPKPMGDDGGNQHPLGG